MSFSVAKVFCQAVVTEHCSWLQNYKLFLVEFNQILFSVSLPLTPSLACCPCPPSKEVLWCEQLVPDKCISRPALLLCSVSVTLTEWACFSGHCPVTQHRVQCSAQHRNQRVNSLCRGPCCAPLTHCLISKMDFVCLRLPSLSPCKLTVSQGWP